MYYYYNGDLVFVNCQTQGKSSRSRPGQTQGQCHHQGHGSAKISDESLGNKVRGKRFSKLQEGSITGMDDFINVKKSCVQICKCIYPNCFIKLCTSSRLQLPLQQRISKSGLVFLVCEAPRHGPLVQV